MGIIVMGLVWGGSMDKVGAFELVGGKEGVTRCIGEAKLNSILMSKLDCEGGWVKGPRAEEMRVRWVQASRD